MAAPDAEVSAASGRSVAIAVLIGWLAFIVHASLFGRWIVDDAGIVFAYARNFAQGNGLVSQIGAPPVEGYSDTLWLLMVGAAIRLQVFDLVWTPKLLSILLVGAMYAVVGRLWVREIGLPAKWALVALVGLSLQTGFVVWCVSGLENALYAYTAVLVLYCTMVAQTRRNETRWAFYAGLASACAALTRPDGILLAALFPIIGLGSELANRLRSQRLRSFTTYVVALVLPLVAFLVFRYVYFGDLLPNPYYAKGGPTWGRLVEILTLQPYVVAKTVELLGSAGGKAAAPWFGIALVIGTFLPRAPERARTARRVIATALAVSIVGYLLMPGDWMGEFRFATAAYVYLYLYGGLVLGLALEQSWIGRRSDLWAWLIVVGALGGTAMTSIPRSLAFAEQPTISVEEVHDTTLRFESFAKDLGITQASILTADVGGALWFGAIRVVDLGMLCDKRIARFLGEGVGKRNRDAFYDYVFETTKPTFIVTRAYYSWLADFDQDLRFQRDYVAIKAYPDQWVVDRYKQRVVSGDFVRRDALNDRQYLLKQFSEQSRAVHYVGCVDCATGESR